MTKIACEHFRSIGLCCLIVVAMACSGCTSTKPSAVAADTTIPSTLQTGTPQPFPATTLPASPVTTLVPPRTEHVYETYENSRYGIIMDYPSDWNVDDTNPSVGTPDGMPAKKVIVNFYSPPITRCDHSQNCVLVRAEVSAAVDEHPGTKDVSEYFVRDVAKISTDYNIQITKSNAQLKLGDVRALRLDYQLQDRQYEIKAVRVYTIISDKAYIITFHTHFPKWQETDMIIEYLGPAQDMISSFRVTTVAPMKVL
jgi:hypothetical protein